ncbi:uncharacterized protein N7511_007317 [Penicillium nucicola]|uniref:uncharacterized protein n=1 Tax=Penicillium nucicola TaxID=1850975 RepID=UPI002545AADC|nr:uncharacterized protein N7511_007317 [Penicillium nucicola]KAJ5757135.1 hypothetical protein N7511_007317 [Penicillium nucicola]
MIPLERPETPPSPLSTVPFTQNPEFISRDNLLDQIHEKASAPGSMVALFGLGGVGKSQLAIEYSYRVRSQSPSTWVFWIHASNAARFEESFRDIADRIRLPGRHDPNGNILRLVQNWLLDGRTSKWVLIVDNVDDDGFLRKLSATDREGQRNGRANASPRPLLEFLPQSSNGSILFTTRSKELALKLVDYRNLIEIEPMKRFEALRLLQKKLELREESEASVKLVEQLEFMPLAIVQAASYIKHRAPRCSVSQYLKKLQKGDSEAIKLLNDKAGDHCREWGKRTPLWLHGRYLLTIFDEQDGPQQTYSLS